MSPPLGEQVLDIAKAEREAMVEPNGVADDFGRKPVSPIRDPIGRLWPTAVNLTMPLRWLDGFRIPTAATGRLAVRKVLVSSNSAHTSTKVVVTPWPVSQAFEDEIDSSTTVNNSQFHCRAVRVFH